MIILIIMLVIVIMMRKFLRMRILKDNLIDEHSLNNKLEDNIN